MKGRTIRDRACTRETRPAVLFQCRAKHADGFHYSTAAQTMSQLRGRLIDIIHWKLWEICVLCSSDLKWDFIMFLGTFMILDIMTHFSHNAWCFLGLWKTTSILNMCRQGDQFITWNNNENNLSKQTAKPTDVSVSVYQICSGSPRTQEIYSSLHVTNEPMPGRVLTP